MATKTGKVLKKRALRLQQSSAHPLFLFALTGKELLAIADISRVTRGDEDRLVGYQRPEVKRHVQDIVDYLDETGDSSLVFPNAIILALSSRVTFTKSRGPQVTDGPVSAGVLEIPLAADGQNKPAWIVDGQQRTLALARSKRALLPVPISAFVADEVDLQRDQFIRVNNQKPLPKGLITELLPSVSTNLPARLAMKRIPAALCEWLNAESKSPFYQLIKRTSSQGKQSQAVVSDTVIVQMLHESLNSPSGALFPFRNATTDETDFAGIGELLIDYWSAVRDTFPKAWGRPPEKSRLMHGAGIRAMGRLMDRIMLWHHPSGGDAQAYARQELARIAKSCSWTSGRWAELDLAWNDIQNVPRHIRMLTDVLIRNYVQERSRAS